MLHVVGNQIRDEYDQRILLRGVNAGGFGDTCLGWFQYGSWNESVVRNNLQAIKSWGCNCVRIMGTVRWWLENCRESLSGDDGLNRSFRDCFLDTVRLAREQNLYVIVSFWSIDTVGSRSPGAQDYLPYPPTASTQNYQTIRDVNDFIAFWSGNSVSSSFLARFATANSPATSTHVHNNNVAPPSVSEALLSYDNVIYEFYNEPAGNDQGWLNTCKAIIDAIRANSDNHLIMVQCGYAQRFQANSWYSKVKSTLAGRTNIVLSNHMYRTMNTYSFGNPPPAQDYASINNAIMNFFELGLVINEAVYPVIIGEIGLASDETQFLRSALQVLNENGCGWSVWQWRSGSLYSGNFAPTTQGQAVIDFLASLPEYSLEMLTPIGGTTTPVGITAYTQGQSVSCSAFANTGYRFVEWLLDGAFYSNAANITVQMNTNHILEAVFEPTAPPPDYTISFYSVKDNQPRVPLGSITASAGTTLYLVPQNYEGYRFLRWEKDGVLLSISPDYLYTVDGNHDLTEFYESTIQPPTNYTLTILPCINGATLPMNGQYTMPENSTQDVEAIPLNTQQYHFDHWQIDGSATSTDNPITMFFNGNHTLQAFFAANPPPPPECSIDADCVAIHGANWVCQGGVCVYVEPPPPPPPKTVAARSFAGLALPMSVLRLLWMLRESVIKPEVHKKLHPLV